MGGMTLARLRASTSLRIFLAFLAIYVVTAPGGYECSDGVLRYQTAKSWVEGRGGALTPTIAPAVTPEAVAPDGRIYAVYGPLQSLLMVPNVVLAKRLSHGSPDVLSKLMFGIAIIPLISAFSMAILFRGLAGLGYSSRVAIWTTVVVGLATPMWHYARSGQEENIVGLGFGLYLLGTAKVFRGRYSGLVLVAVGVSVIVATRWSYTPTVGLILLPVGLCLWRQRQKSVEWRISLGVALTIVASTVLALFWYNYHRFSNPFETGYGLSFRQHHMPLFVVSQAPANAAALLFSPFRGLLWFCPTILVLVGLRVARLPLSVDRLWPFILAVWVFNIFLISSLSIWNAGFAWGPRYLMAPIILLAPLLAAVFASGKAWWWPLVAFSTIIQFCSTVLPSSAENYVYVARNEAVAGTCSPWTCDCTATCLRLPWSLKAIENTAFGRPLPVLNLDSDSLAPFDAHTILASSDYNSVCWWLIRAAYRARKLSPSLALALCMAVLVGAAGVLCAIYRRGADVPGLPISTR
jgi:hypothetical protein